MNMDRIEAADTGPTVDPAPTADPAPMADAAPTAEPAPTADPASMADPVPTADSGRSQLRISREKRNGSSKHRHFDRIQLAKVIQVSRR